MGRTKGGRR